MPVQIKRDDFPLNENTVNMHTLQASEYVNYMGKILYFSMLKYFRNVLQIIILAIGRILIYLLFIFSCINIFIKEARCFYYYLFINIQPMLFLIFLDIRDNV